MSTKGMTSWNRLPEEKRLAVIEMYRNEMVGTTTISRALGLGKTTILRIIKEAGIKPDRGSLRTGPGRRRFEDDLSREIATKYEAGASLQALAIEYNCTNGPIRRAVKLFGRGLRRKGPITRAFTAEQIADMKAMWECGMSQTAIGAKYGVRQTIISNALKLHGITVGYRRPRGERHGSWKGGTSIMTNGYVSELLPPGSPFMGMALSTGRVQQHRLVMAKALGRLLRSDETVHHINGNKQDNRLANLELRQGKHGKHIVYCCADCGSRNVVPVSLG